MARAYGARTFQEEKTLLLERARSLPGEIDWRPLLERKSDVWRDAMDFRNQFQHASTEIRNDREAALAAVAVYGHLLKFCSEPLRNDLEIALKAVDNCASAFWEVSKALKLNKALVLRAVQIQGALLVSATKDFRNDPEVVFAAVNNDGAALEYASQELRSDKDIVLAAVECDPRALDFASEALRADREVVIKALKRQSEQPAWKEDTVWEATSRGLKQDKDFVLLAMRTVAQRRSARGCYEEADSSLKRSIQWRDFLEAALSAIASPGEAFPVLTLTLQKQPPNDACAFSPHSSFACEVTLLSGNTFVCQISPTTTTSDYDYARRSDGDVVPDPKRQKITLGEGEGTDMVTLNDLAVAVLSELPRHTEVKIQPERGFFNFLMNSDGETEPVSPWDW
eukprot:CAMPEP_0206435912 /NCGR_PEP_ID=MMETSP0324_2-20121206/10173_1 /ASSEMBLY_ACC=CAM_ASM_000836 /TAXON_ID=2866 /ORGANISM="Crypthecodinium cohnii, Strain Seligo" /LENGTH=396 /DNA_ID=CAMNT_0053902983 /DNA_START=45 /DNA_END=1232 /DNA_ORIENTATION=-